VRGRALSVHIAKRLRGYPVCADGGHNVASATVPETGECPGYHRGVQLVPSERLEPRRRDRSNDYVRVDSRCVTGTVRTGKMAL
jgi:hypothetical protein